MRYSTVWFYQAMARRAGYDAMRAWIDKAGYGNRDIGTAQDIDHFWLNDSPMRISAEQQIDFLRRLADNQLPFSDRAQETVRRISISASMPGYVLHAKTGWDGHHGWYVGWVESHGRRWFFAMNMDIDSTQASTYLPLRLSLTKQLLGSLGAFHERNQATCPPRSTLR